MASIPATDYFPDNEEELYKNKLSDLSSISINYNQDHRTFECMTRISEHIEFWQSGDQVTGSLDALNFNSQFQFQSFEVLFSFDLQDFDFIYNLIIVGL
ncbi:hypothetical protein RclHR1_12470007 [Rhizophagus clarus]|uniref:Uncharacterized protein n=1 Tax=Rhizophagus clarus TaxID=94130 RepID=A0A2Z6R072_9GLOM|nr:hypothetical protein RclHR1_12470007 [Rhizophagus clarus]